MHTTEFVNHRDLWPWKLFTQRNIDKHCGFDRLPFLPQGSQPRWTLYQVITHDCIIVTVKDMRPQRLGYEPCALPFYRTARLSSSLIQLASQRQRHQERLSSYIKSGWVRCQVPTYARLYTVWWNTWRRKWNLSNELRTIRKTASIPIDKKKKTLYAYVNLGRLERTENNLSHLKRRWLERTETGLLHFKCGSEWIQ